MDGILIFNNPDKESREQPTDDFAFIPNPSRVSAYICITRLWKDELSS